MSTRRRLGLVMVLVSWTILVGCAPDGGQRVLRVPADYPTVQAAVDTSAAGDLVLVAPGTYHEGVEVDREGITVRGEDRNGVVFDGQDRLLDGFAVTADGVAIENLTVQNYRQNGVIFNGSSGGRSISEGGVYGAGEDALVGFRVSYVTAANNGIYGIYAFASRDGLIEHSLASGSPDSGIYVGQCKPCNVVVTESIAEYNAIGYYGTNASGGVYVVNSVFRNNRLGMTPNSQRMELLAPQVETVIAGNLVIDNDEPSAPAIARGFFGGGIVIGGGASNVVVHNRVEGHDAYGIALVDLNAFDPAANRVEMNTLDDNSLDLYYELRVGELSTFDNCFAGNEFTSSSPADIEALLPCDAPPGSFAPNPLDLPAAPPNVDYRSIPLPAPQPTMPGDVTVPPSAPAAAPAVPDVASIATPARPS